MKSSAYVIMWLTIFLVLILAIVLALVLLLLAEFYCSPLTRHNRNRNRQLTPPIINNSSTHSPSTHANPLHDREKQPHQPSPENQETRQINSFLKNSVSGCSLVYISNPIYYGEGNGTPFETPESSPSRLEMEDDESEEVLSKECVKDVGMLGTCSDYTNGVSSSCLLTSCSSSTSS